MGDIMNISTVTVALSEKDIISIINDFVKVKGLNIEAINLRDFVEIKGSYKTIINIPFAVKVALGGTEDNHIHLNSLKINLSKLSIWNFIKRKALKIVIKNLKEQGIDIDIDKDVIILNLNDILKKLSIKLELNLKTLSLREEKLYAEAEKIEFSLVKEEAIEEIDEEILNEPEIAIVKKEDGYSKFKRDVEKKVPEKYNFAAKYMMILPDFIALFYRLFKDSRVEKKTKIAITAALGYLASPIDILPDSIPFIGKIDDMAIMFFILNKAINEVPLNVILENWQGEEDIIKVIREGINHINLAVGGDNINKVWSALEKMI